MNRTTNKSDRPTPAAKIAPPKSVKTAQANSGQRRAKVKPVEAPGAKPVASAVISKQDQVAELLLRNEGATLDQMIAVTGWLPHTTRAALTGLKKKGFVIDSDKLDGIRTYRAVAPQ